MSLSRKSLLRFYKYGDWKELHSRNMNVSMTVSNIIILMLHVNKITLLEKQKNKKTILTEEKDSNRSLKLTLWLDWPNKLLWTCSLIPNTISFSLLWFLLDCPKPC